MPRLFTHNLLWVISGLFLCMVGAAPAAYAARLVTGDFNNDGRLDLALLAGSNRVGSVCVLLANDDGTFGPPAYYSAGPSPIALLAGDLNNDGNLDLLTLNPDRGPLASGVSVLLGNGDGTFRPSSRAPFPAGTRPRLFSLADLNGDGNLDVAVVAMESACSLIGRGDGTFDPVRCFSLRRGFADAHTLLTADVNGDGRDDFIAVSPDTICLWAQTTREPLCTPTRIRSRIATGGDFTNDGIFDIALVGNTPTSVNMVCIYAGTDGGGYQLTECTPYRTHVNINLSATGDLDGDGALDLVLAGSGRAGGEVIMLFGNGEGGFEISRLDVPIAPLIDGLAVADLNGDNTPDIILSGSGQVCVFPGEGGRGFGEPQCFRLQPPS